MKKIIKSRVTGCNCHPDHCTGSDFKQSCVQTLILVKAGLPFQAFKIIYSGRTLGKLWCSFWFVPGWWVVFGLLAAVVSLVIIIFYSRIPMNMCLCELLWPMQMGGAAWEFDRPDQVWPGHRFYRRWYVSGI